MGWIILDVVVLLVLYFIVTYNGLVSCKNKVKDQWSQIEVLLKRRADLIPNLVETVKGYATHEKETFEDTLGGGDGETWSLLLMEGTTSHIVGATALEGDKISHNLLYSGALQNSVNC